MYGQFAWRIQNDDRIVQCVCSFLFCTVQYLRDTIINIGLCFCCPGLSTPALALPLYQHGLAVVNHIQQNWRAWGLKNFELQIAVLRGEMHSNIGQAYKQLQGRLLFFLESSPLLDFSKIFQQKKNVFQTMFTLKNIYWKTMRAPRPSIFVKTKESRL
jgi:hypothetical protein